MTLNRFTVLRDGEVAVVIEQPAAGLPHVLHWGADLGPLEPADLEALTAATGRQTPPGTLDAAWRLSLVPVEGDGWSGRPGLAATRGGVPVRPRWTVRESTSDAATTTLTADAVGLRLRTRIALEPGGVVTLVHELENTGDDVLELGWLEATLPVPKSVTQLSSFTGRWPREKVPTTTGLPRGSVVRQSRRGRGGHDNPVLFAASADAPRNRSGAMWAVHLAWSADVSYRTDHVTDGALLLGAGELLRPGELVLAPGERYASPAAHFVWSAAGWDGLSERVHRMLRARPAHPRSPRPLVLNTWEAVYFDHDPGVVAALAERAASVGVERFVLDDGWFLGRRDDTAGLGDWVVDRAVWPDGLGPLAARVHGLGMQFGLWFEPEMVNLDSELARAHPDWLLHAPDDREPPAGVSWRNQHVLDLANPEAYAHVLGLIDSLVSELGIDFIKWDHNRDLVDAWHDGRPGVHAETLATYRMMAELRERHPALEIESCSSGGARTDLGVLAHTQRVWASDANDAVERQDIQRWTGVLLPPELVGGHVGPSPAHNSGRVLPFAFRAATSLLGSAGFELNLLELDDAQLEQARAFGALYRELRGLVHTGTAVHPDGLDPALRVRGFVAPDRAEAVFTVATVAALEEALPARVTLPGLDPARRYRIRVREELGAAEHGWITPAWLTAGSVTLPGAALAEVGLQLPTLFPFHALILHLTAEP